MQCRGGRRAILSCVVLSLIGLSGCSTDARPAGSSVRTATSEATTTTTAADPSAVNWTNCGDIECGVLRVPSTHRDPASRQISVGVYSRKAVAEPVGTVVLLPDYDGPTARDLAELPTAYLGAAARRLDVLAVSPRGFFDSAPLPCTLTMPYVAPNQDAFAVSASCRSNEQLNTVAYGVKESVGDLETLVSSLGIGPVSVVGWGRGATIAAVWKLLHPASISSMVLDSPDDPGISPVKSAALNRAAEDLSLIHI